MHSISVMEEQRSLTSLVKKFTRRADLTSEHRLGIAIKAISSTTYGSITRLSASNNISRTFVYELKNHLLAHAFALFGPVAGCGASAQSYLNPLYLILQLRLIGGSSLSAISEIMCNLGVSTHSTGYISETLDKFGSLCPCIVEWQGHCVAASDEIYYIGHQPILVTVEVSSLCILQIKKLPTLTKEAWEDVFKALPEHGIHLDKLLMDEGRFLQAARPALSELTAYQPDTFHALSFKLGLFNRRLAKDLAEAMEAEKGREIRYFGTSTPKTADNVYQQYLQARQKTQKCKELLEQFQFLYYSMLAQMRVFKSSDGRVCEKDYATQEVQAAIDLMRPLAIKGLSEVLDKIQKILPNLFNFLETAKKGVEKMAQKIEPTALLFWARAWQRSKIAFKTKGNYDLRTLLFQKMTGDLDLLKEEYKGTQTQFDELCFSIFRDFDTYCTQSSAAVENVNAFLRPFINQTKGQITQNMLNLLMFYHNHKIFKRGKRKGYAPIEILTDKKLDKSWMLILLNKFNNI
jgi:hypothetical protein